MHATTFLAVLQAVSADAQLVECDAHHASVTTQIMESDALNWHTHTEQMLVQVSSSYTSSYTSSM